MLQRLLDGLAGSGVPGVKVDDEGCCALTFADKITVNLDYDDELDLLTLYCRLGTIAPDRAATIYPLLLEANVLWAGTGGATLGVIPDDRSVVLAYQERAAAIDGQRFESLLSGLVDAAEFWMKLIEDRSQDAPEPSAGGLHIYHQRA
jgi:hypothetical protein